MYVKSETIQGVIMSTNLSEIVGRLRTLTLPSCYPDDVDIVRLINHRMFMNAIASDVRYAIVSLIAKGVISANDIAEYLGISRTGIYRHLNILQKCGLLIHRDGKYFVASRMFLVYDVDLDNDNYIKIRVYPDKGGFVDEDLGFVLVKGGLCRCDVCKTFEKCLKAVKNLAKKLEIKVRSENPLDAFVEIVREIVYRDVLSIIKNGYLIVKMVAEPGEIGRENKDEETNI